MKLHQSRLQADLSRIRDAVADLAAGVREAVNEAVRGVTSRDEERMYAVILDDLPYNRASRALDRDCHHFVARHIPAAGHLRFVSSVLRLSMELERIGDYAVTICRVGVHLEDDLPEDVRGDIRDLADQSSQMLERATRAFLQGDAALAKESKAMAKVVDRTHDRAMDELVRHSEERSLMDVLRIQTIYDKLERVSDQAKNICEEAIFSTTGETKEPKTYRVLFLDGEGDFLAPLAEALARRSHPNTGAYAGRGLVAAAEHHPSLLQLAEELELDVPQERPLALEALLPYPADYHVIVSLNLPRSALPPIPFHTILQRWTFEVPASASAPKAELVREILASITHLMEKLRGADAS